MGDASGRKLARFSGGESAVTLLAPPVDGSDLARIETGTGRGSFRLTGFVKASELRIFTNHSVPVVSGHVWLGAGARVTLAGNSGGKVRIEKQLSTPFNQRFTALTECSALTFTPPSPPGFSVPGSARVFLMKVSLLDLYGNVPPTGSPLHDAAARSHGRQRALLQHRAAWRLRPRPVPGRGEHRRLGQSERSNALPRGETSDVPPSSYTMSTPPQLQLPQAAPPVKTTRELPLRVAAQDAEAPVGVIEAETEVYVMDTDGRLGQRAAEELARFARRRAVVLGQERRPPACDVDAR